jgi:N6-adenosine-specific RNA methylase IME4
MHQHLPIPGFRRSSRPTAGGDIVESARGVLCEVLARVEGLSSGLTQLAEAQGLIELRAWTTAAESAVKKLVADRKEKWQACQNLIEARLRIERALGAYLATAVGHTGGGNRKTVSQPGTPTPRDLPEGITRNESSRFQRLATIPDKAFELFIRTTRDKRQELSTEAALRVAKTVERERRKREQRADGQAAATDIGELVATGVRFGCIMADPPWRYDNTGSNGAAEVHYPTMTLEAIAGLPVRELAAQDSHCHLWTTGTFLPAAFHVLAAWGFSYKGLFTWVKPEIGPGNYWRSASEYMLLGIRGSCPFLDNSVRNWIEARRTRHSEKPEAVRKLVEKVSPKPRLELFGRRTVPGWTVWGNEVA